MLIQNLTESKNQNEMKIEKMANDKKEFNKKNSDAEDQLITLNTELKKVNRESDKNKERIKELEQNLEDIKSKLNNSQQDLENANKVIMQLDEVIRNKENEIAKNKIDKKGLEDELKQKIKDNDEITSKKCEDFEKNIANLNILIQRAEKDKEQLIFEKDKILYEKRNNDDAIESYKNYIIFLTQQNQKLIAEIENVCDQDERMKEQLSRKDRILTLLRNNKNSIEMSLKDLGDFLGRSTNLSTQSYSTTKKSGFNSTANRYTYNTVNLPASS